MKHKDMTLDNSAEIIANNLKRLQDAQVLLKEAGIRLAQCIRDTKSGPDACINWDEFYSDLADSLTLVASNTQVATEKIAHCATQTARMLTKNFGTEEQG